MTIRHIFCKSDGVKAIRGMLDLTQNDLAKITGLTKMTISNYENGKKVHGTSSLIIGYNMYNILFKSNFKDQFKVDVYNKYFWTEDIEL